jgi:hypothetical protein
MHNQRLQDDREIATRFRGTWAATLNTMNMEGYWFKSSKFEIEPGEDEEINPQIYGRQLAAWLKLQLEESGYSVESIGKEDWGRCLMCARDPFMLWVGCGNMTDMELAPDDAPPKKEDVVWHCFVKVEVFFWKRWFRKIDTSPAVSKLHTDLGRMLAADPQITLVEEPQ